MPTTPPLDPDVITARLAGVPGGFGPVTVVAETGSTNADVIALARAGAPHGTTVVAGHQSAGRGRFVRRWEDARETSVAMSVLLRPDADLPLEHWGWLPLVVGLGVGEGLRAASGLDVHLKWPNDLLLESGPRPGKLVGILVERVETPLGPAAVAGVGINVAMDVAELPVETATSLLLGGADVERSAVTGEVLAAWSRWYARWAAQEDLSDAYRARCATIGRQLRVQLDEQRGLGPVLTGVATGVDAAGSLLVRDDDGTEHAVSAGDVVHVRPA